MMRTGICVATFLDVKVLESSVAGPASHVEVGHAD